MHAETLRLWPAQAASSSRPDKHPPASPKPGIMQVIEAQGAQSCSCLARQAAWNTLTPPEHIVQNIVVGPRAARRQRGDLAKRVAHSGPPPVQAGPQAEEALRRRQHFWDQLQRVCRAGGAGRGGTAGLGRGNAQQGRAEETCAGVGRGGMRWGGRRRRAAGVGCCRRQSAWSKCAHGGQNGALVGVDTCAPVQLRWDSQRRSNVKEETSSARASGPAGQGVMWARGLAVDAASQALGEGV